MIALNALGPAVALIAAHRLTAEHAGGKAWDAPGIRKALTDCHGPLPDIMRAALLAAEDASLHAPSAEAFRVRWQRPPAPAPAPRGIPCHRGHGHLEPCPQCAAETGEPVHPGFVADLIASLPRPPASHRERTTPRSDPARLDHLRNRMETTP